MENKKIMKTNFWKKEVKFSNKKSAQAIIKKMKDTVVLASSECGTCGSSTSCGPTECGSTPCDSGSRD